MDTPFSAHGGASGANGEERFEALFRRLYRPVVNFFRQRGFSAEESPDLAQETFLRAYRRWGGFRGQSRAETWLFKIATHVAINTLRYNQADKRNDKELSLEEALENGLPVFGQDHLFEGRLRELDALDSLLAEEKTQKLRQVIEELPPRMRECVFLRLNDGHKYKDIATLTGVSIDTVKAQLFQARHLLRERLEEVLSGPDRKLLERDDDE